MEVHAVKHVAGRPAYRRHQAGRSGQGVLAIAPVEIHGPRGRRFHAFAHQEEALGPRGRVIMHVAEEVADGHRVQAHPASELVVELLHVRHHGAVPVVEIGFPVVGVLHGGRHQRGVRHDHQRGIRKASAQVGEVAGAVHRRQRRHRRNAGLARHRNAHVLRLGRQHRPVLVARGMHGLQAVQPVGGVGVHHRASARGDEGQQRAVRPGLPGHFHRGTRTEIEGPRVADALPGRGHRVHVVRRQAGACLVMHRRGGDHRVRSRQGSVRELELVLQQPVAIEDGIGMHYAGVLHPQVVVVAVSSAGVGEAGDHQVVRGVRGIGAGVPMRQRQGVVARGVGARRDDGLALEVALGLSVLGQRPALGGALPVLVGLRVFQPGSAPAPSERRVGRPIATVGAHGP